MDAFKVIEPEGPFAGLVYVVEDEPEMAGLMGEFLSKRGYRVGLFRDGYQFMACLKAGPLPRPDCVVCDWRLEPERAGRPRIDAPSLLRMVEHYLVRTPALVVSGYRGAPEDVQHVMLLGARGLLPKPLDLDDLGERVQILVRSRNNIEAKNLWSSAARVAGGMAEAGGEKAGGDGGRKTAAEGAKAPPACRGAAPAEKMPLKKKAAKKKAAPPEGKAPPAPREALPPELAWQIDPAGPVEGGEVLNVEVIEEFAVSFEDLIREFEDSLLQLEEIYKEGVAGDFPAVFEIAQRSYRNLHTLKGNAGFVGGRLSTNLIHMTEELLNIVRSSPEAIPPGRMGDLVDAGLAVKDVLGGLCRYMQLHRSEAGYETTPAHALYENLCGRVQLLAADLQAAAASAQAPAGGFDEMF